MSAQATAQPINDPVCAYITERIDALNGIKSQREIATEAGLPRPNVVSMIKKGDMKLPLERVPAFARAINADPAYLFRLVMEQYWPGGADVVSEIFGTVTSRNEAAILNKIRQVSRGTDPALTPALEKALEEAFGSPRA